MKNGIKGFLAMLFIEGRGETQVQRTISYLTWAAMVVALIGSIMSALGICTGGCTDAQNYRFFGLPFATIGISFFVVLAAVSFARNDKRSFVRNLYNMLLAGILGAEWIFMGVQSRIIKHYCPVCLAIAIAVFVAVGVRLVEVYLRSRTEAKREKGIKEAAFTFAKSLMVIGSMYAGLILALIGVSLPVDAGSGNITQNIWLGKADSHVEVLVIADWFCPYCRQVEPTIEAMLPEIGKVAKYSFIDDPIHRESYSFIPANMSLLLNSKAQYIEGRKVLLELAEQKKAPTDDDIAAALKAKGINLKLADTEELKQLARSEAGLIQTNAITLTPTVLVRNSTTGAHKILVGTEEITREKVAALIAQMGK